METGLPMEQWAAMAGMSRTEAARQLKRAWKIFACFQSAYPRKRLARTLYSMLPYSPDAFREIALLFYAPQLLNQALPLAGTIDYIHPLTGDAIAATLDSLMDEAADRASTLCRRIEPAVFDGAPLDLPEQGPSMDAGISKGGTNAGLHFSPTPFPALD